MTTINNKDLEYTNSDKLTDPILKEFFNKVY